MTGFRVATLRPPSRVTEGKPRRISRDEAAGLSTDNLGAIYSTLACFPGIGHCALLCLPESISASFVRRIGRGGREVNEGVRKCINDVAGDHTDFTIVIASNVASQSMHEDSHLRRFEAVYSLRQ